MGMGDPDPCEYVDDFLPLCRRNHSCSVRTIRTLRLVKSSGTLRNFIIEVELYRTLRILRFIVFTVSAGVYKVGLTQLTKIRSCYMLCFMLL